MKMLLDLLEELQEKILEYCKVEDLTQLSICNRELNQLCEPYLWRNVKVPRHLLLCESIDNEYYCSILRHLRHTKSLRLIGVDVTQANRNNAISNTRNLLAHCSNLRIMHTWFLPPQVFDEMNCSNLREVCLTRYAANDDSLATICRNHPQLQTLALENGEFSNRASECLSQLKMLLKLRILYCNISFDEISGLVSLKELVGSRCGIGNQGVQTCCNTLVNLEKLVIYDTFGIVDLAFSNIRRLVKLRELNLSGLSAIGDPTMNYMRGLQKLQILEARSTMVSDEGLASIAMIKGLRKLDVSHCAYISNAGIRHLVDISTLEVLNLNGCGGLTDVAISAMSAIRTLKDLSLCGCYALTDNCVPYFKQYEALEKLDVCGCRNITALHDLSHIKKLLT